MVSLACVRRPAHERPFRFRARDADVETDLHTVTVRVCDNQALKDVQKKVPESKGNQ